MTAWYIAKTKSRKEAELQTNLLRLGVEEVFFPRILVQRRRNNVLAPLFPTYIFCRFSRETVNWPAVRWARGIQYFLGVDDSPSSIPDELVEDIKQRVEQWNSREDGPQDLSPGQSVRIIGGSLAGMEGVFEKNMDSRGRIQILLTIFGRLVRTEIDKTDLAEKFPGL